MNINFIKLLVSSSQTAIPSRFFSCNLPQYILDHVTKPDRPLRILPIDQRDPAMSTQPWHFWHPSISLRRFPCRTGIRRLVSSKQQRQKRFHRKGKT